MNGPVETVNSPAQLEESFRKYAPLADGYYLVKISVERTGNQLYEGEFTIMNSSQKTTRFCFSAKHNSLGRWILKNKNPHFGGDTAAGRFVLNTKLNNAITTEINAWFRAKNVCGSARFKLDPTALVESQSESAPIRRPGTFEMEKSWRPAPAPITRQPSVQVSQKSILTKPISVPRTQDECPTLPPLEPVVIPRQTSAMKVPPSPVAKVTEKVESQKSIPAVIDPGQGVKASQSQILMIPVLRIRPNPDQPRSERPDSRIEQIAGSLKEEGLNQPIEVIRIYDDPKHDYELIKGETRWLAAMEADMEMIEAIVRPKSLIPNKQAQYKWCLTGDLYCPAEYTKLEKARAMVKIQNEGKSINEIAKQFKVSNATVSNYISISNLIPELANRLDSTYPREKLPFAIGWRLGRLPKEEQMPAFHRVMAIKGGSTLRLHEIIRILDEKIPERHRGRKRKPGDNVKVMLGVVPRIVEDAVIMSRYPESTMCSLWVNRPDQAEATLEQIDQAQKDLTALKTKLLKAKPIEVKATCIAVVA